MRTEGIAEQFHRHPGVKSEADDGCRGLANEFPGQVSARGPVRPSASCVPARAGPGGYFEEYAGPVKVTHVDNACVSLNAAEDSPAGPANGYDTPIYNVHCG
ncbi:hypothetical protein OOK36_56940 [Streptomyces sp. NBC_00365]|uniref:hypothetical protein n=1 Tax=Streptomyces sp. NBC_00365 TaxID=2975726 RepID=UPI00224ECC59|nr:hypothetical protein [Streptomyces sp. NBC_00365]MCX5097921.1 hypothetical protein [Streptomyces sp. NBC_00365]